jgi:pyruvate kinase
VAKLTGGVPNAPLHSLRRVKIIATVGPATDSYEVIHQLIKTGAAGLRLNFSHGSHEERTQQVAWIRRASHELGKPVAIIQDLQGPKIRLGDFEGVVTVQAGQSLSFAYKPTAPEHIPVQYDLSTKVKRGERLYLYDGKVRTVVTSVQNDIVHVRAENDGILIKRKGINLPDTDLAGDIITAKDRKDLAYGSEAGIDYVALSFVQTAEDIEQLRRLLKNLGSSAKIIAKVETKAAVDNIEQIVEAADVVMVARGDLAVETATESVPVVQRQIIGLGLRYAKPTIVATQMLASMTDVPEPTRAEVSDVATAVLIGADCLMLSDETASGKYPVEAVSMMRHVIRYTEANTPLKTIFPANEDFGRSRQSAISTAIINLAKNIAAKAIVAETRSGATALQIAARRPETPIIAVTNDLRTAQQLAIVFGVRSYVRPAAHLAAQKLTDWLLRQKVLDKGDAVVLASGRYPGVVGTTDTIKVRMLE